MSSDSTKSPVAVLGAGSWGTALAILIARNGYPVWLWGRDSARMAHMQHERRNPRYLPDTVFPESLQLTDSLEQVGRDARQILAVVPSHAFRATLQALAPHLQQEATLAWATKGLEQGTGKLLSDVILEELGDRPSGVVSGPTFARECAAGLPMALTTASKSIETADKIAEWLRNDRVRVYLSEDVAGVQLGGAIKNVMAIAAGISDGLGFGANARAALITRGLAELTRLGITLGGSRETFMGLTGVGDLVLTCTDDLSRNRQVGLGLGRGRKLPEILAELGQEAEGVTTARELYQLARRQDVEMPITEQVYRVLYEGVTPRDAVEALFQREPRIE